MKPNAFPCRVNDLRVTRDGQTVLDGIQFEIPRGAPFAIVGESGSGKTTLLFALTGLIPLAAGSIRYGDLDARVLDYHERASVFGLVFQDYQLFPHLTAMENLLLAPQLRGLPITASQARDLLGDLGVGELVDRRPHQMSGGQKQRVAIARCLIQEPRFLFLDEPSAALDEKTTQDLAGLLRRLNEKSQIVVVSHDRPFLTHFVPQGIRLEKGKIAAEGNLPVLFS
jgi:ABC-type lipoprotein export system ATPase subunit